jgi:hypothetical protein
VSEQTTFTEYVAQLTRSARVQGEQSTRSGDPDAFDACVEAVRAAATEYGVFSTDDLQWPVRGPEVGAAFSHLRRLGEIEPCGYRTSTRAQSHGRLIRVWRTT